MTKKETTTKETSKKSANPKTPAGKAAASKPKRTSAQKSKSPIKKGKVKLSPMKAIFLCFGVIVFCLALLLGTSIIEKRNKKVSGTSKSNSEIAAKSNTENIAMSPFSKSIVPNSSENATFISQTVDGQGYTAFATKNPNESESTTTPPQNSNATEIAGGASQESAFTDSPTSYIAKLDVPQSAHSLDSESPVPEASFNFPPAVNHAELVFLFDDGGQNLNQLQAFLDLPIPITVAVLPKLQHSAESASRIRKSGNEVMLHQPMQAINSAVNPGPGAIKPEMTSLEIAELVQSNIDEIAPISGMNNHEGSLITADESKIRVVLDTAAENGIFFLDSRTNVETKVPAVSRKVGYGWYERNGLFLDNEKTRDEFLTELRKNLDIANKSGSVIMIGHIWSADYLPDLIREVYPELKAKGYTFTTVSKSSARRK